VGTRVAPEGPFLESARPGASDRRERGAIDARTAGLLVLVITVLGGALRFATLDVQSIWLDESATLLLVHRGFSGMLSHLGASESTPPLYYVAVWAWTKVFGAGPVAFRSFSALVGTLTIPVMYLAGRRISSRAGVWAAALTAVNPAMYYYSQEARAYALLIFLSAVALVCWQRALDRPDSGRLWLWALASALALLTHYFAAFLFIPEALILARRVGWRRAAPAIGAVIVVGLALTPLALRQRSDGKANWIEGASLANRLAESAKQFLVGLYGPVEIITAAIAGLLALGAVILLLRRGEARERRGGRDMALLAATALAIPAALAVTHLMDIYDGRNVIAAWVPLAVLVAAGLGVARAPLAGAALGAALCTVFIAVIIATNLIPGYQRDDWRGIARALPPRGAARIIVGPSFASAPLSIYRGPMQSVSAASVSTREIDFVALRTRRTGRAPSPAVVPLTPPAGFTLAGVKHTETFAISRFTAASPTTVSSTALRRLEGEAEAEVILER
jgi:mannosyltransferase